MILSRQLSLPFMRVLRSGRRNWCLDRLCGHIAKLSRRRRRLGNQGPGRHHRKARRTRCCVGGSCGTADRRRRRMGRNALTRLQRSMERLRKANLRREHDKNHHQPRRSPRNLIDQRAHSTSMPRVPSCAAGGATLSSLLMNSVCKAGTTTRSMIGPSNSPPTTTVAKGRCT